MRSGGKRLLPGFGWRIVTEICHYAEVKRARFISRNFISLESPISGVPFMVRRLDDETDETLSTTLTFMRRILIALDEDDRGAILRTCGRR